MTGRRYAATLVAALASLLVACSDEPPAGRQSGPTDATTAGASPAPPSSEQSARATLAAPQQARRPGELARRLVAAEDRVRDTSGPEIERVQAAFETQVLYRQLARRTGWQKAALAAAGRYRAAFADHIEARTRLRSVLTRLSDELPAWRVVAPEPVARLRQHYREGERTFGVPWEVLAAVNLVETGFGKIRGYSTAGARGPMQFIPSTWEQYGEGDIDDPRDSILAAARYLAANGGDAPAGLDGALHAYNHHDGYVRGVRAYARILERDPAALEVLYRWQIIYLSERGDLWLPQGYLRRAPLPVARYVAQHPERALGAATD